MANLIAKAKKGDADAMSTLYNQSCEDVFRLCILLTDSENAAFGIISRAYKSMWELIVSGDIDSEEAFDQELISRTVSYCKSAALKKNSKAFNLPANKNFSNTPYFSDKLKQDNQLCLYIVRNLPPLHRFVYVLHYVFDFDIYKICKLFKTNTNVVNLVLNAEDANIRSLLSAKAKQTGEAYAMSADSLHKQLLQLDPSDFIPNEIDETVASGINIICKPLIENRQRRINRLATRTGFALLFICLIVIGIWGISASQNKDTEGGEDITADTDENGEDEITEYTTEYTATHYADITVEGHGTITVALDENKAPATVQNFIDLANDGFYDGLTFHRILNTYFVQGGDPSRDGTGGSGNTIDGEFTANGHSNNLSHIRGAISMAHTEDDYNSATSQFFIMQEDYTAFDGYYAVFGYVVDGIQIVDDLCAAAEPIDDDGLIADDAQPVITSVVIREATGEEETDTEEDSGSEEDSGAEEDSATGEDSGAGEDSSAEETVG